MSDMMLVSPMSNIAPKTSVKKKEDKKERDNIVLYSMQPQNQLIAAKVSPKEAMEWIAVVDALASLVAKFGPDILDIFRPKSDKQSQAPSNEENLLSLDEVA